MTKQKKTNFEERVESTQCRIAYNRNYAETAQNIAYLINRCVVHKIYLSTILDLYDRRIVSFVAHDSNNNVLIFNAFEKSIEKLRIYILSPPMALGVINIQNVPFIKTIKSKYNAKYISRR